MKKLIITLAFIAASMAAAYGQTWIAFDSQAGAQKTETTVTRSDNSRVQLTVSLNGMFSEDMTVAGDTLFREAFYKNPCFS